MKRTVLITGATGYFGKAVVKTLIETRNYNIHLLFENINDYASVAAQLKNIKKIDVIIHLAALVPSFAGSASRAVMLQTNHYATKNLASLCDKNTHFIFLSTDYVFNSNLETCWDVNDKKDPETDYGFSKSLAEDWLSENKTRSTIIRTSMLYGYDDPKRKNFIRFLYEHLEKNKKIEVYSNVYARPTHVFDLSQFLVKTIENKLYGTIHACGEDYVSRYELSNIFCEVHEFNKELLVSISQPPAGRLPNYLNLKSSKIFVEDIKFSLQDGIKSCLRSLS